MENGLEILEELFGVFLFIIALTILFRYCDNMDSLSEQVKDALYFNHVLYMEDT